MNLTDLLKGKIVDVDTNVGVVVQLEIESVEEKHNSRDLEPSTQANDWWPKQKTWTTFIVKFTNKHTQTYHSLSEIKLHKEK